MERWRATRIVDGMVLRRVAVLFVLMPMFIALVPARPAHAVASLIQTKTAVANATTVAVAFSPTAGINHLLIAVCASRVNATLSIAGFTTAKREAGTPSQGIFYKISAGTETTVTCTATASGRMAIHIYEYSGNLTAAPLDTVNATASTGNSTAVASGSLTTTNANDMIFAAASINSNSTFSAWSGTFTERNDFKSGTQLHAGAADRYVATTGTYTSTATATVAGAWRGQIVAFKLLPIQLTADIVDAAGVPVVSPSTSFSAANFNFSCQTVTATLGAAAQKLRVSNTTATPGWLLSIAATGGPTTTWSDGGTNTYDFNDPTGAGCTDGADVDTTGGQLTVNPSVGTLTPVAPCLATGVTKGASSSFSQGVTDSITLLSAVGATLNCTWDFTGISLSQKIPGEQLGASYSLGLTLTLIAQ